MQGVGGEAPGHSFVHDDDAGPGANLSAARVVYPVDSVLVHQEQGVTVFLNAGLEAIGSSHGPVPTLGLSAHEKNSFAALRAKDEAGFDYIRENKNSRCFRFTFGGGRILRHQLLQSAAEVADQIVRRGRASTQNCEGGEDQTNLDVFN
jgi:hypothetical protein